MSRNSGRGFFYLVHQAFASVDEIGFSVGGKFSLFERIMDCSCHLTVSPLLFSVVVSVGLAADVSILFCGEQAVRAPGMGKRNLFILQLPWLIKVFRYEAKTEKPLHHICCNEINYNVYRH